MAESIDAAIDAALPELGAGLHLPAGYDVPWSTVLTRTMVRHAFEAALPIALEDEINRVNYVRDIHQKRVAELEARIRELEAVIVIIPHDSQCRRLQEANFPCRCWRSEIRPDLLAEEADR